MTMSVLKIYIYLTLLLHSTRSIWSVLPDNSNGGSLDVGMKTRIILIGWGATASFT